MGISGIFCLFNVFQKTFMGCLSLESIYLAEMCTSGSSVKFGDVQIIIYFPNWDTYSSCNSFLSST
jgi:hypothetical protein